MATETAPAKTPAWFVVWECHCTATATEVTNLPHTCPGHDRLPVAEPELLDVLDEYVNTHLCGAKAGPCPREVTA